MTIKEKRLKLQEHCNNMKVCSDCKLADFELKCRDVIKYGSDEEVEKVYNFLTYGAADVTRNLSAISDRFFCEKCRAYLENWMKYLCGEDTEYTKCQEYKFKVCPECKRKVVEE